MQVQNLRAQRFNNPLSIGSSSNTVAVFANSPLILQYKNKNPKIDIHKQAINGLISYGKKHNLQKQSLQLCQILQKSILSSKSNHNNDNDDNDKIGKTCIYLYTFQSFLYKEINKYLRNAQFQNAGSFKIVTDCYQKVEDLLPFCVLLHEYVLKQTRDSYEGVVYRGCNLNNQQIQEQWNGFTSTTKNKLKAEMFGNVLFQIKLGQHQGSWGLHYGLEISKYSAFPNEEEVILFAGMQIYIQSVKKENNKYIITITCTDLGG